MEGHNYANRNQFGSNPKNNCDVKLIELNLCGDSRLQVDEHKLRFEFNRFISNFFAIQHSWILFLSFKAFNSNVFIIYCSINFLARSKHFNLKNAAKKKPWQSFDAQCAIYSIQNMICLEKKNFFIQMNEETFFLCAKKLLMKHKMIEAVVVTNDIDK